MKVQVYTITTIIMLIALNLQSQQQAIRPLLQEEKRNLSSEKKQVFYAPQKEEDNIFTITVDENRKKSIVEKVQLSTEQVLRVKLPRSSDSPSKWILDSNADNILKQMGTSVFEFADPSTARPGAMGYDEFTFVGKAKGDVDISFILKRAWLSDDEQEINKANKVMVQTKSEGAYTGSYETVKKDFIKI